MNQRDYEDYVQLRSREYVDANYCAVAIPEEAGEVAGYWKKYQLRGNPGGKLAPVDLMNELGDVLFYVTRMASLHGWTLSEVMDANKTKLDARAKK